MSFLDHFEDFLGQATATEKRSGWCFYMLLGDLLQCHAAGRSGVVFMLAILNTAILIMFMIHVMTCPFAELVKVKLSCDLLEGFNMI